MRSIDLHRTFDAPVVLTRLQRLFDAAFGAAAIVILCLLFGWGLDVDTRAAQEDSERHARRHGVHQAEAQAVITAKKGSVQCVAE
jgi:hypothetical protein